MTVFHLPLWQQPLLRWRIWKSGPRALDRYHFRHGGTIAITPALYSTTEPQLIEHILGNWQLWQKRLYADTNYFILRPLWGDSIVSSDGDTWAHDHRIIMQSYQEIVGLGIAPYSPYLATWASMWTEEASQSLLLASTRIARQITTLLLFGTPLLHDDLHHLFDLAWKAIANPEDLGDKSMLPLQQKIVKQATLVQPILQEMRRQATPNSMFGKMEDHNHIADAMTTLLFSGHKNIALAISWTMALLAAHPEEWQRVAQGQETDAKNAIQEAMRLYPIYSSIGRTVQQASSWNDMRFPQGSNVLLNIWRLHRNPNVYANPDHFQPMRWLGTQPPRYNYLPFGAGPRACIFQGWTWAILPHIVRQIAQSAQPNYAHQLPKLHVTAGGLTPDTDHYLNLRQTPPPKRPR